jgi:hypothetical protein
MGSDMEQASNPGACSSEALLKYHQPDLVHRPAHETLLHAAGGLEPTLTSYINGPQSGTLDLLFGRHDIALPAATTEYVRTRMAVTLQVEAK